MRHTGAYIPAPSTLMHSCPTRVDATVTMPGPALPPARRPDKAPPAESELELRADRQLPPGTALSGLSPLADVRPSSLLTIVAATPSARSKADREDAETALAGRSVTGSVAHEGRWEPKLGAALPTLTAALCDSRSHDASLAELIALKLLLEASVGADEGGTHAAAAGAAAVTLAAVNRNDASPICSVRVVATGAAGRECGAAATGATGNGRRSQAAAPLSSDGD